MMDLSTRFRICRTSQPVAPLCVIALAVMSLNGLAGCGEEAAESTDQIVESSPSYIPEQSEQAAATIRLRLADAFVNGSTTESAFIKADRFDALDQHLYGIRMDSEFGLLSAARATIEIDPTDQTAQLILYDVVTVAFDGPPLFASLQSQVTRDSVSGQFDESPEGDFVMYEILELDPFSITE